MIETSRIEEMVQTGADEGSFGDIDREQYIAEQEARGFKVVVPEDNELQIDIDSAAQGKHFNEMFDCYCRNMESDVVPLPFIIRDQPSKSGLPRRHITIVFPRKLTNIERIAYQSVFGSDPWREVLSMVRHNKGDIHPTLFVEKGDTL